LAALPGKIVAAQLPVTGLALVVPTAAPDPDECASLAEIGAAVTAVADAARRVGLGLRHDPTTYVPPCVFARAERVAHLFAMNRGNAERPGFRHVAACETCRVADRCPGLPAAWHGNAASLRPVADDRLRRRLTVGSTVEEQVAREFLTRDEFRGGDEPIPEYTVRVNFHCNQSCEFCFVSTHLPPAAENAVRAAIEEAGRAGAALVLSGGEPTLNPRLAEYVRLAKASGVRAIELQSNAIRLANAELAAALVGAGLDRAMISLHGSNAEISDAVTGAPGTFESTVRGIDTLTRTPVDVRLNFVFCQINRRDFPHYVDYVARRWPGVGIVFSFVGSHTDVVPRSELLIPRFADVIPSLVEGLARARTAGVEVYGFESMCGLPLCLVPEEERGAFSKLPLPADAGGGEFVKFDVCAQCAESYRCFGLRRGYAELYGADELSALSKHTSL
jgi:pyruvate-formate lyase-activating enzyme